MIKKIHPYFTLLIFILMLVACRKKIIREVVTQNDFEAIFCSNGEMDEDELGVDCGGDCEPCLELIAPCDLEENELNIFLGFGGVQNKTFTEDKTLDINPNTGYYTYTAYTSPSEYLIIQFSSKPDISKSYTYNDVFIKHDGNYTRNFHGNLYVNYENGYYVFSSCNADFYNDWNESSYPVDQSFKIIFD